MTLNFRFTKKLREQTYFPKNIISQLVGHLLGDGSLVRSKTSITPYFIFTQSIKKSDYIWHVFANLGSFCNRLPILGISRRGGKVYPFLQVMTRSYPIFLTLYHLFYLPYSCIISEKSEQERSRNSFEEVAQLGKQENTYKISMLKLLALILSTI